MATERKNKYCQYTKEDKEEIWNSILAEMISGRSLRSIINDPGMPNRDTIYDWLAKDEKKSDQYARCASIRADIIFDELMGIADSTDDDLINLDNGKQAVNHHVIMRDRFDVRVRIKSSQELITLRNGLLYYINSDSLFQHRNRVRLRQYRELLARYSYDIEQLDSLQKVKYFEETRSRRPPEGGQMIFLQEQATIPGKQLIELAATATILLSVFAHGITAAPAIGLYARRVEAMAADAPERRSTVEMPIR